MATPRDAVPRTRSSGAVAGYAVFVALGLPAMCAAWTWLGFSYEEEMSEQCKAVAAQTTMDGTGATLGVPPLVVAHVIGLLILWAFAARAFRTRGAVAVAVVVPVVACSVIGIVAAELLYGGQLFEMGAAAAGCG